MQLLQGAGGSGGENDWSDIISHDNDDNDDDSGDGSTVGNIMQILMGLAKSYFNIKGKSNASIQVGNILKEN